MVTLYNVIDTRSGKHHSVAMVSEENVKWFIPAETTDTEKTNPEE